MFRDLIWPRCSIANHTVPLFHLPPHLSLFFHPNHVHTMHSGCFGFGITEHIDLGLKYDPSTGIFGMDFYVVLARPGLHVSKRKYRPGRIGKSQKVSKDEAIGWFKQKYEGLVM